jgi:hypothetical protein
MRVFIVTRVSLYNGSRADGLEEWIRQNVVDLFRRNAIEVSVVAEEFLLFAARAQILEGLLGSERDLIHSIDSMPLADLVTFYKVKYGNRKLTFNRAVRLTADLHDRWIETRNRRRADSSPGVEPPVRDDSQQCP